MTSQNNLQSRFQSILRFIKFRILHIDDSPHRIAIGVALGLFIAWTPLIGLHIFLALMLTFLLKANKFAALASIWASNPLTFIFIYYPNYLFGKWLLKCFQPCTSAQSTDLQSNLHHLFSSFTNVFTADFWNNIFIVLFKQGQALWLGSVVLGLLVAGAGYTAAYLIIKSHRKKLFQKTASANC